MPERGRAEGALVFTTLGLPKSVWMAAKIEAMQRRTTLRALVIAGLEHVSASRKSTKAENAAVK